MESKLFIFMHRGLMYILCSFIYFVGTSQVRYHKQYDILYNHAYSDSELSQTTKNMFVIGQVKDIPGGVFVSKIGPDGEQKFFKTYTGPYKNMEVHDIHIGDDDGLFITGSVKGYISTNDLLLMNIDSSGQINWSNIYIDNNTTEEEEMGFSITTTSRGNFLIGGSIKGNDYPNKDFLLMNATPFGSLNWSKTYDTQGEDILKTVVTTANNEHYLGGDLVVGTEWKALVVKVDEWGNVLWSKSYSYPVTGGGLYDNTFFATSDGGCLVSSHIFLTGSWVKHALIKLDASGNISWKKLFQHSTDGHFTGDVREDVDGNYLISGTTTDTIDYSYLIKLTPAGILTWIKSYQLGNDEILDKVFPNTSHYTFVGAAHQNFQILTTDSLAQTTCVDQGLLFTSDTFSVAITNELITSSSPLTEQAVSLSPGSIIIRDNTICSDTLCDPSQSPLHLDAFQDTSNALIQFFWTPTPGSDSCQATLRAFVPGVGSFVLIPPSTNTSPLSYPVSSLTSKFLRLGVRCFCNGDASPWGIKNIDIAHVASMKTDFQNKNHIPYYAFFNGKEIIIHSKSSSRATIVLYNSLGQAVEQAAIRPNTSQIAIDAVSSNLNGHYFILISDENGSMYSKSIFIP